MEKFAAPGHHQGELSDRRQAPEAGETGVTHLLFLLLFTEEEQTFGAPCCPTHRSFLPAYSSWSHASL